MDCQMMKLLCVVPQNTACLLEEVPAMRGHSYNMLFVKRSVSVRHRDVRA